MHALWQSFIYTARRHPLRFAMADGLRPRLNYFQALAGRWSWRAFAKTLAGTGNGGHPAAAIGSRALLNFAAMLMGKAR